MADLFLIPQGVSNYLIANTYSVSSLSIEITAPNFRPSWYRTGYLKILLPIGLNWVPTAERAIPLTWHQIVEIPYQIYRLSFTPVDWFESTTLVINPYIIQYNPIPVECQ